MFYDIVVLENKVLFVDQIIKLLNKNFEYIKHEIEDPPRIFMCNHTIMSLNIHIVIMPPIKDTYLCNEIPRTSYSKYKGYNSF